MGRIGHEPPELHGRGPDPHGPGLYNHDPDGQDHDDSGRDESRRDDSGCDRRFVTGRG